MTVIPLWLTQEEQEIGEAGVFDKIVKTLIYAMTPLELYACLLHQGVVISYDMLIRILHHLLACNLIQLVTIIPIFEYTGKETTYQVPLPEDRREEVYVSTQEH